MTKMEEKASFLSNQLSMAGCPCPQPAVQSILSEVFALFSAQVPPPNMPTGSQEQDTLNALHSPGILHRMQLRQIVRRHVPLMQVEQVWAACLDLGQTLTIEDCLTSLKEGRESQKLPVATVAK